MIAPEWDPAELDALGARLDATYAQDADELRRRLEAIPRAGRPRLLLLPGEPGTPAPRVRRHPAPDPARVALRLVRAGTISREEARAYLGLPPTPPAIRAARALGRELRRWRVTWR